MLEPESGLVMKEYKAQTYHTHNDLIWIFFTPKDYEKIRWEGYNDSFWWDQVSTQPGQNRRLDSKGRIWELDFDANVVKEIQP